MSDPVSAANALAAALDTLRDELAEANEQANSRLDAQSTYGQRNRHMIWGLVISLILDVALTFALVTVSIRTTHANDKATQAHNQQIATCQSSNEARAVNRQLWDYVLSLPAARPRTAEQEKRIADFKGYVHRVFADRDCSKI